MNKLISRNPIQQFKQGKKIIKGEFGFTFPWQQDYEPQYAPHTTKTINGTNNRTVVQGAYNKAHKPSTIEIPYANADKSVVEIKPVGTIRSGHDYQKNEVEYRKVNGNWAVRYKDPNKDTNWYWVSNGTRGYDKAGNYNEYQNGKWVTITPVSKTKITTSNNKSSANPKTQVITNATNSLNQTINNNQDILTPKEPIQSRGEIKINVENNPTGQSFNSQLAAGIRDHYSTPITVTNEDPSFYGKGITDFNRGSIRGFRNQDGGFRNVDEYYNWLNNNQDSDQYKLWNNVLEGMDEETRRNTFNQIMNQFGISGNLGRRDSQRLANVLNILRDLGVNGSANQTAFMDAYDSYSVGDDGTVYSSPWVRSLFERFNAQPSNNTNFAEQGKQFLQRRSPHSYAEFGIKRPGYMTYGEYLTTPSAYTQRTGLDTLNNTNGFRQTITNWLNQNPGIYNKLANIFTTHQPSVATPTYVSN